MSYLFINIRLSLVGLISRANSLFTVLCWAENHQSSYMFTFFFRYFHLFIYFLQSLFYVALFSGVFIFCPISLNYHFIAKSFILSVKKLKIDDQRVMCHLNFFFPLLPSLWTIKMMLIPSILVAQHMKISSCVKMTKMPLHFI